VVWNDWLLALHLLAAFAMVAAIVVFWVIVVVARGSDLPETTVNAARLLPVGSLLIAVGSVGTIVFGVWLAIALDGVKVWDGWVIAAIVLWAIGSETGRRAGDEYDQAVDHANELVSAGQTGPDARLRELARTPRGLTLHAVATLATLLILVDMVWKPGA
jgi:hypothetical protein